MYVASIILVVALLITLVSLLTRDLLKKARSKKNGKTLQKNNYKQRKRYIKKLHLVENDIDDVEADETQSTEAENVYEAEPAESVDNTAEAPVEETLPEAEETVEETPAETESENGENKSE